MRAAWRANLRQELLAPVDGIIELTDMLLHDARERERADLLADLGKVHDAGEQLRGLIQGLLEPPANAGPSRDIEGRIRHDLCNCLNPIIGYCEQWLEDADDLLLEAFVPDLEKVRALGKQIAVGLDKLLADTKVASDPEIDLAVEDLPEMFRWSEPNPVPAAGRGAVLVVDDNETNRDLIGRWLRRDGHTVAEARDGREALTALRPAVRPGAAGHPHAGRERLPGAGGVEGRSRSAPSAGHHDLGFQ